MHPIKRAVAALVAAALTATVALVAAAPARAESKQIVPVGQVCTDNGDGTWSSQYVLDVTGYTQQYDFWVYYGDNFEDTTTWKGQEFSLPAPAESTVGAAQIKLDFADLTVGSSFFILPPQDAASTYFSASRGKVVLSCTYDPNVQVAFTPPVRSGTALVSSLTVTSLNLVQGELLTVLVDDVSVGLDDIVLEPESAPLVLTNPVPSTTSVGDHVLKVYNRGVLIEQYAFTVLPLPPVLVTKPVVSGTVKVGQTVSCKVTYSGATLIRYKWLLDGIYLPVTTKTYLIDRTDYLSRLSCATSASNAGGVTPWVKSAQTVQVALGPALKNISRPTYTGTMRAGYTVKVSSYGKWSPTATSGYKCKWLRNGVPIKYATKCSYRLTSADRGKWIQLYVTAYKSGYAPGTARSYGKKVA